MTKKETYLIYNYMLNNRIEFENEVKQLQQNVRFRKIDIPDCVELMCAMQRLDTFKEVTEHIRLLLKLGEITEIDDKKIQQGG